MEIKATAVQKNCNPLSLIPYGIYRLSPLFIFPTLITLMMLEIASYISFLNYQL